MTTEIDVRDRSGENARTRIVQDLDALDVGESATIRATDDVTAALAQFQITRGRRLEWYQEPSDGDAQRLRVEKTDTTVDDVERVEFDVRDMPPQKRHSVLTDTFDMLDPNQGFVLVNDHDPKPLYHELRSIHGDVVEWEYRARDPNEWRVEIGKSEASAADGADVAATFDVRQIPKQERHSTIHHRYANLSTGAAMDIIAPHEPRPLQQEFQQRYGDGFEWEVLEQDPNRVRVRIIKERESGPDADADAEQAAHASELTVTEELDVRDYPPAKRHELIFDRYANLQSGEAFELVNDHDPKPLYHQFDAEAGPEFRWEYQQRQPGEFRVHIGKAESANVESGSANDHAHTDAPF